MSKTTQENKKKALKEQQKVEVQSDLEKNSKSAEEQKAVTETETVTPTPSAETRKAKSTKVRSKRYQAAKKKIDVTKYYPLQEAVKLVQETSLSKFDGKVEAHITITDIGNVGEISFPHLETASKKIVVLNDTILAQIKDGQVDFDILIATPATMPKLLPFAKILGPKGLMPNPKNGTLTDDPDAATARKVRAGLPHVPRVAPGPLPRPRDHRLLVQRGPRHDLQPQGEGDSERPELSDGVRDSLEPGPPERGRVGRARAARRLRGGRCGRRYLLCHSAGFVYAYDPETGEAIFEKYVIEITDGSNPDGMCVDMEGMIWVAQYGGEKVCRWDPESGGKLEEIRMPVKNVTSCCLGGKNLEYLYITTAKDGETQEALAGGLFRVKLS